MRGRTRFALLGALLVVLIAGCAPSFPQPYLDAKAAAEKAYGAKRFDEAASHYAKASTLADRERNRDEMLFLEAASYQRGHKLDQAYPVYEALLKLSPSGERAPRAALEMAQIQLDKGNRDEGYRLLHQVVLRYPTSGLARPALGRFLAYLDETQGKASTAAYLQKGLSWFERNGLGEEAMYQRAMRLEQLGQLQEARDLLVQCAKTHPYPHGSLFDDSLYRASLLDEQLGEPKLAIEHLQQMLYVREPSTISGSYERPRFSQAQMRIATLYRDKLGDSKAARREFRKLFDDFRTSILRDDALWSEAKLAVQAGDKAEACDAMQLLIKHLPESRYVPCAKQLCDSVTPAQSKHACPSYITEELSQAQ